MISRTAFCSAQAAGMLAARTGPDAVDLAQPVRRCLDDVKDLFTKGAHELFGIDRSHASNHARGQVFLDAIGRGRRRGPQKPRFELLPVGAVVDPIARSRDPLTGGNACGMADHGHDITMTTRPGAQNAKTVLGIVIRYALDEARQYLLG
jgi:hypothetical protein